LTTVAGIVSWDSGWRHRKPSHNGTQINYAATMPSSNSLDPRAFAQAHSELCRLSLAPALSVLTNVTVQINGLVSAPFLVLEALSHPVHWHRPRPKLSVQPEMSVKTWIPTAWMRDRDAWCLGRENAFLKRQSCIKNVPPDADEVARFARSSAKLEVTWVCPIPIPDLSHQNKDSASTDHHKTSSKPPPVIAR